MPLPPKEQLLARREITDDGCWEWQGARLTARGGYGQIRIAGRLWAVHRLAWIVWRGQLPQGICVLHRCDNPPCFNPAHLFLGTKADNHADMKAKGRQAMGDKMPHASLNADQIRAIRADGRSQTQIARAYGVGQQTISRIKRRERWGHILDLGH